MTSISCKPRKTPNSVPASYLFVGDVEAELWGSASSHLIGPVQSTLIRLHGAIEASTSLTHLPHLLSIFSTFPSHCSFVLHLQSVVLMLFWLLSPTSIYLWLGSIHGW